MPTSPRVTKNVYGRADVGISPYKSIHVTFIVRLRAVEDASPYTWVHVTFRTNVGRRGRISLQAQKSPLTSSNVRVGCKARFMPNARS